MSLPASRKLNFSEIPVISLGGLSDANRKSVVEQIDHACCHVGFFYIVDHGFDGHLTSELLDQAQRFFSRPETEKRALGLHPSMRGYLPIFYKSKITDTFSGTSHQEGFWIGHDCVDAPQHPLESLNRWPENSDDFRIAMTAYLQAVEQLAETLGNCFFEALGQSRNFYRTQFSRPTSRLKLNHYPPQDNPQREDNIGVVPHTDSGGFTILWQDSNGGLEVQSKEGEWVVAPPIEHSFVVNIGDILKYWSNGRYSSTHHRVVNRYGVDRFSIPYFVNPNAHTKISALDGSFDFEPFDYGDYQSGKWRDFFPVDQSN
ncbi:MAG: 2OG-Fe(II) oxygenase family protein [Pseudomonadota bacterium]